MASLGLLPMLMCVVVSEVVCVVVCKGCPSLEMVSVVVYVVVFAEGAASHSSLMLFPHYTLGHLASVLGRLENLPVDQA